MIKMMSKEEMSEMIDVFRINNPEAIIEKVVSYESTIGCELIDHHGHTLAPHTGIETVCELQKAIVAITNNPFLWRLYTALMMYTLYQRMRDNRIKCMKDPEEYFADPSNMSQNKVQVFALELLKHLANQGDDELVSIVCSQVDIEDVDSKQKKKKEDDDSYDDGLDIGWEEDEVPIVTTDRSYDIKTIFSTKAINYSGGCLIAANNPIEYALEAGQDLLVTLEKVGGIKYFQGQYDSARKKYEREYERFQKKSKTSALNPSERREQASWTKLVNGGFRIKEARSTSDTKDVRKELKTEMMMYDIDLTPPNFDFPMNCQINTAEFVSIYSPHLISTIDHHQLRHKLELDDYDLGVTDSILTLLLCGVGIFSYNHHELSQQYLNLVLDLASNGRLAFVVSDDSICYGANYPFKHVVVQGQRADKHSIRTLYQLFGRAGRFGRSWTAYAYLTDEITRTRFVQYIRGLEEQGTSKEARNLIVAMNAIRVERTLRDEARKAKEAEVERLRLSQELEKKRKEEYAERQRLFMEERKKLEEMKQREKDRMTWRSSRKRVEPEKRGSGSHGSRVGLSWRRQSNPVAIAKPEEPKKSLFIPSFRRSQQETDQVVFEVPRSDRQKDRSSDENKHNLRRQVEKRGEREGGGKRKVGEPQKSWRRE